MDSPNRPYVLMPTWFEFDNGKMDGMTLLLAQPGPNPLVLGYIYLTGASVLLTIFACRGSKFPYPNFRFGALATAITSFFVGAVVTFLLCFITFALLSFFGFTNPLGVMTFAVLCPFIGCLVAFMVARNHVEPTEKSRRFSSRLLFVTIDASIFTAVFWVICPTVAGQIWVHVTR